MPWLRDFLLSVISGGKNNQEKPVMARIMDSLPNGEVLIISDGEYSIYAYLNKEAASTLTSATLQGEKLSLFSINILKCHFTTSVLSKDGVERVILHIIKVDRLLTREDSVQTTPKDVFFSVEIPKGIRVRTFPYCLCNRKKVPNLIVMCINDFESNVSRHQYGILRTDTDNKIVDSLPLVVKNTKKTTPRSRVVSRKIPSESPSSGYNLRSSASKQTDNPVTLVKKPKKVAKKIENTKEKKERKTKLARSREIATVSERITNTIQTSFLQQQQKDEQKELAMMNSSMIEAMRSKRVEMEVDGEIVIDAINEYNDLHKSVEEEEEINGDKCNECHECNRLLDLKSNRRMEEEIVTEERERERSTNTHLHALKNQSMRKEKKERETNEEEQTNTSLKENNPEVKKLSGNPVSMIDKESAEDIIKMISLQNNDIEFESSDDSEQEQKQSPPELPSYVKPLYEILGIQNSSIDIWNVRWRM